MKPGESIDHASRAAAGTVTSSAFSPTLGHIAAARLRNEAAAIGGSVQVGPVTATVVEMPLLKPLP